MKNTTKSALRASLRNMNLMTTDEVVEKMGKHNVVTLTFYKMDGSLRVMKATRNFAFTAQNDVVTGFEAPTGDGLRYNNTINKLVTVFDLESKGFRQVPANRMLSVVVG